MRGSFSSGFAGAVADIRQKLLEEGWFGKAVTPRAQTITIGSPGEDKSPGEQLGWWRRDERSAHSSNHTHDRDATSNEKAPERGIDL